MSKPSKNLNSEEVYVDVKPELIEQWISSKLRENERNSEMLDIKFKLIEFIFFSFKTITVLISVYILIQIINLLNIHY